MKILFECDNGDCVVELHEKRLYAKVEANSKIPVYGVGFSHMLNPGHFKEYREEDAMLEKHVEKIIADDMKKALYNGGKSKEAEEK